MDKISIITTFYNAQTFISNAIGSVLGQKVPDGCEIEYVLVDDKSQDNSRKLVENIINNTSKENFEFKLVEPETNLGCGGARKFGIENATGNYFMFLDADDYYIHLDFVENAYNTITSENADVIEYGVIYNQQNGQQTNSTAPQKIVLTDPHDMEIALFKDNLIKFNVWSKIYTRKIVESYPYSTRRTFEDVRTIPVWISNCNKVVIMPIPQINYRAASNSIIRTNLVDTRLGTISAIAQLFPRFKDDRQLLKAMYTRSMIDLEAIMGNKSSECEGFDEMSKLNTYMLKFIYPDKWKDLTYNVEMDPELNPDLNKEMKAKYIKTDLNNLPGM
jgi:glycosyltransferase involved in cell wall biosynthesis